MIYLIYFTLNDKDSPDLLQLFLSRSILYNYFCMETKMLLGLIRHFNGMEIITVIYKGYLKSIRKILFLGFN